MRTRLVSAFVAFAFLCAAERGVTYNDKNVTITGMVVFPSGDDPVFGEIAFPAIVLDEILTAKALPSDSLNSDGSANIVQLAASASDLVVLERLEGKRVTITCSDIFSSITGHHFTPILCTPGHIQLINTPRPNRLRR
jgi:hypothetical protein